MVTALSLLTTGLVCLLVAIAVYFIVIGPFFEFLIGGVYDNVRFQKIGDALIGLFLLGVLCLGVMSGIYFFTR
jgi:hypothetical protein